jgi:hypothetical protein
LLIATGSNDTIGGHQQRAEHGGIEQDADPPARASISKSVRALDRLLGGARHGGSKTVGFEPGSRHARRQAALWPCIGMPFRLPHRLGQASVLTGIGPAPARDELQVRLGCAGEVL